MIVGKGHDSGRAWLWSGFRWEDKGDTYGNTPCCFDHAGHLLISRPVNPPGYTQIDLINGGAVFIEKQIGAQGIWYADGTGVHTGDECSIAQQPDGQLIHDFTVLGDVTIGQGHESGAHLTKGTDRHLVEGGLCRFMHPDRVGNDFAIPIWKEADGAAVIIRATLAELLAQPAPPIPPVDVPVLGKACWLGFFAGTQTADGTWHTDTPPWTLPGNSYLSVPDDTKIFTTTGAFAAVFVAAEGEGTVEALEAAVQAARHWGRPVLAYWPRSLQGGRTPACDWLGVECYLQPGETPAQAEIRWRQLLGRVPTMQRIGIIAQSYNAPDDVLSQLVPVYIRLARDTRVVGIFPFNGSGRPGGLQNRPTVKATWQKAAEGIPAHPPIQEIPVVAAPKFTIVSPSFPVSGQVPLDVRCVYQNEPGGGELEWIEWLVGVAANGPWSVNAHNFGDDPDHTYHFTNAGTYFIKARGGNAAGTHETASERKVTVQPRVPPIDPPPIDPVPPSDKNRYRTTHGGYLQVGPDAFLREGSTGDVFEVVASGKKNYVGLKVKGAFVAAEPDARLKADRSAIGDWEYFIQTETDAKRQFLSVARKKYISAHDDGTVKADHSPAGGWETFTAEAATGGGGGTSPFPSLRVDGRYFSTATGEPWHAIEATDFNLVKLYMLDPGAAEAVIAQRAEIGFLLHRVWMLNHSVLVDMHPNVYPQMYDALAALIQLAGNYGMCLEVTAFTSTRGIMPNPSDQQAHWDRICGVCAGKRSVLLEAYNEGDQYDNLPTITLSKPHDVISSRGSNGSDSIPPNHESPWDYEIYHIIGNEWQRKTGHNAMEWADQSGKPCITNEAQRFDDNESSPDRAYDSAAGGALLCAGTCFHSQQGKQSQIFSGRTLECAQAFVNGARSVPLEYRTGAYAHDTAREQAGGFLRSYSRTLGDGRKWFVDIRS